jgi:hypothetical protein
MYIDEEKQVIMSLYTQTKSKQTVISEIKLNSSQVSQDN